MITVTIAAVDRSSRVEDISIDDTINNQVDTCAFSVLKAPGDVYVPALNDEVIVALNGTRLFGGVITTIDTELTGANTVRNKVSAIDFSFLLNRKLVTKRYTNQTINAIIADLVTNFTTGFTVVGVVANINVTSIAFNRITVAECLRKLADLVNYSWYVDYFKDIHFFAGTTQVAPFIVTSGNFINESLKLSRDISQIRNRVLVQGGEVANPVQSVRHAGDTETTTFPTQYKFATRPTVTVNGAARTVGVDFLDSDASFQCMWDFNQKYIRFTAGNIPALPLPPATTNILITGNPLLPLLVNVPNPASINQYGEWEFAITDTTIITEQQAIDRAIAELRGYANSITEGSFETYTAGLRSGQVVRITDALRGIDEDFIIQKVGYSFLSPSGTYEGVWSVTVATLKTVGIISVLQKLLLKEDLSVDEQKVLLSYLEFADTATTVDSLITSSNVGPFVWAYLVNGTFADQPAYVADTNTFARWIDGTAAGSTANNRFGWALVQSGSSNCNARFDKIGGLDCVKMIATNLDKAGASIDLVAVSNIIAHAGATLTLAQLATATPVVAGITYNVTAKYYLESVSHVANVQGGIRLTFYNAAGTRLTIPVMSTVVNTNLNNWSVLTASIVAPAGAVFLVIGPQIVAVGADGSGRAMTCNFTDVDVVENGKTTLRWGYGTWS